MSSSTDFEAMSDSQYLVSLESRRRDETDFNEDVLECEPEQEERDNKSSEDEQNSNGSISVQERGGRGVGRGRRRGSGRGSGRGSRRGSGRGGGNRGDVHTPPQPILTLPGLPEFELMQNTRGLSKGHVTLPSDLQLGPVKSLALFELFFSSTLLQTIVDNTNNYEQIKGSEGGRLWIPLTLNELKVWFALVIYMGVHKIYAIEDLWNSDEKKAIHSIKQFMTLMRFQQIKRFLHISPVNEPNEPHVSWYSKVEPLASHIRETSKRLYIPCSQVSVDEMIARFSGRSAHTVRMKNKPTPEGYKILSLCDAGYTYTFMFTSRVEKNTNIEPVAGLNETGRLVWHLVKQLPQTKTFHVYMDNYFSNIPLFKYMRDNGIGACGTVRTNSAKFPKELKVGKTLSLDWNTLCGKVIDNVLATLWIDNGPVTMLTTIHKIGGDEWKIIRNRRRPRETSSNSNTVRQVFGNAPRKELAIPKVIDDYNHYMGGVDIADQLRGYYNCQLTVRRTWFPLLFWLLDTVLVNCSILYHKATDEDVKNKVFRINLAWDLIKSTLNDMSKVETRGQSSVAQCQKQLKAAYVTKTFELPVARLLPGDHFPEWREQRAVCIYCQYLAKSNSKSSKNESQLWCIKCDVPLCCSKARPNCFKDFHTTTE
jgi:Transposase IS4